MILFSNMLDPIQSSINYLRDKMFSKPKIGIILGTGLGGLVEKLQVELEIPYQDIPNFPVSTVSSHKGTWIFGKFNGVDVVVLNGRFHYYEGYTLNEVTMPIQIMKEIGIEKLILSNAAGGMNPAFKIGDIMIITDHINFFGINPLIGPNDDNLGPRFPDMSEAYSKELINIALTCAKKTDIHLQQGVYLGLSGPCFETPAEYRMFHYLGADAVGMSTVPETIMARHRNIKVFALSVITDLGITGKIEKVSLEEVLKEAEIAGPKMVKLIYEMMPLIS